MNPGFNTGAQLREATIANIWQAALMGSNIAPNAAQNEPCAPPATDTAAIAAILSQLGKEISLAQGGSNPPSIVPPVAAQPAQPPSAFQPFGAPIPDQSQPGSAQLEAVNFWLQVGYILQQFILSIFFYPISP